MKKIFLFLLLCFSLASITSCGSDDDNTPSKEQQAGKLAEYKSVLLDITATKASIAKLQEEAKGLSGGRQIVVQEQISRKMSYLSELQQRKKQLEKELGL